jgi:tetratricopeptide (TPR) repeat protein
VNRTLAVLGIVGLVLAGVAGVWRLDQGRQYLQLVAAGERALDAGNSYAAIEAFSGAVALRPNSMVAYLRRGEAYHAQRRDDEAIRDLREAMRRAPDATQPVVALGDLFDAGNDPARAADMYAQAVARLQDQDPQLLYKLALARYRAGTPAAAIDPLRRAIARNDSNGEAHYLLGLVYRDTQDVDRAISSLERAVKVAPSLIPAHEELADLYRSAGRAVDEMRQLQTLATLDDHVERSVAIGLAEARRAQYDGALGTLSGAGTRAPTNPQVQLAIARVYLARAERTRDREAAARALKVLEHALGGTARRSEGLALFGRAMYLSGDYAGSERILREAIATSPVDLEAFAYLADSAEHAQHFEDARDALLSLDVLQGDTVTGDARTTRTERIGVLSFKAGDSKSAVLYLGRAAGAGRADAGSWAMLAQARWQTGDLDGARDALARGLALDGRHPDLLRLRRTIR